MDDATIENGCLYVVPGSHRNGYLYPQKAHDKPDQWDFAGCSYGFDESKQVPVEVKAGSVVFFNGYLLHCSYPNRSKNQYRRVLVNHYMNAWSFLPWHPVPNVAMAQVDCRKVESVAGVDPYAWKGYEKPWPQEVWLRTCKANQAAVKRDADHKMSDEEKVAIAAKG
jgi:phytanoyl-CoA hydroxylase